MDRKAFINAYENAAKQSKEEKLQYNPFQILALSMPTILGAGATGITNTRKFRMYAATRQDPMRKKSLLNITEGLGRRIFLGGVVGLSFIFTSLNYETQLKLQKRRSIKEAMLTQGFDIDSGEGKTFLAEYTWGKMKEGMLSSSSGRMLSKKDDTAENLIKRVNFQNEIDDHKSAEDRPFGKRHFETESVEIKPVETEPIKNEITKNETTKNKITKNEIPKNKSSEIKPHETEDAELKIPEYAPKKLTNLKNPKNWKNWTEIENDTETKAK
jgi:hypothetical protein